MPPDTPDNSLLGRICRYLAYFGGALLLATTPITLYSVLARKFFDSPLTGDFEIVQTAVAACIACFLPYCQLQGGNIVVDFFTTRAGRVTRARMDSLGALLLGGMMFLLGWRGIAGCINVWQNNETTMLMGIPVWIAYAAIIPGFLLTCIVAALDTVRHLRSAKGGRVS